KEQLTKEPSWIQSALAVLKPVIVLPIIVVSLLAVLYMQFTPARKMAVHKFDVQKAPPVSEMSEPRLRDNRELATEEKKELKSLGYVGDDESDRQKDLAARRQSVPKSSEVVGGESEPSVAFDSLEKESRSDQPQAEVAPPAAPEAASAPAEAPASPANEGYVSRGETKQEQLGLGHKAAKVAGLTGQSNFQEAQMKFREDNLKEGWTYANKAIQEDRTGSLASEFHSTGKRFQATKDYDKAIVQFQLVADNYRDYAYLQDVLLRLAASHIELGQWDEARAVYQRLLRLYPSNKDALDHLNELNKKEKAQRQLQSLEADKKQD
ncbi:MAG TPA: tetratricopeptide repeat protein, partial [Acidobacteriota bacterium]